MPPLRCSSNATTPTGMWLTPCEIRMHTTLYKRHFSGMDQKPNHGMKGARAELALSDCTNLALNQLRTIAVVASNRFLCRRHYRRR